MRMKVTTTVERTPEIRALTDTEIENVSGGNPLLIGAGLGILFTWGAIAGDCIASVYYGGDSGVRPPEGVGLGA